jgi:hypothetical protein
MVLDIGSHCRLGLGLYVSLSLRDNAAVPVSLFGERVVIPAAPIAGVECSEVFTWAIY